MTIIKTNANATTFMRTILKKTVSPLDIAKKPHCLVLSVSRSDFVDDASSVSSLYNIADTTLSYTQASEVNMPSLEYDSDLGRESMRLSGDQFMDISGVMDYTSPFTLLTVIKIDAGDTTARRIFGKLTYGTDQGVGMSCYQSNGNIIGRYTTSVAVIESGLEQGSWECIALTYDGEGGAMFAQLVDGEFSAAGFVIDGAVITETGIRIGEQSDGMVGLIDMTMILTVDVLNPANSGILSDVKTMLSDFYGDLLN